ncbi:hypothetical protein DPMN_106325 [Dreissena polymorpha]|uniref:Uncharacterized protein n=1 Tax=Dreissena polymorpha TaxID=45954 RepID=A0A9D4QIE0_DREPO|nr:hypothetical protein DPMN_106325 [Dreissena polymorpha]
MFRGNSTLRLPDWDKKVLARHCWHQPLNHLEEEDQPVGLPSFLERWDLHTLQHVCHAAWCFGVVVAGYEPRRLFLDLFNFINVFLKEWIPDNGAIF